LSLASVWLESLTAAMLFVPWFVCRNKGLTPRIASSAAPPAYAVMPSASTGSSPGSAFFIVLRIEKGTTDATSDRAACSPGHAVRSFQWPGMFFGTLSYSSEHFFVLRINQSDPQISRSNNVNKIADPRNTCNVPRIMSSDPNKTSRDPMNKKCVPKNNKSVLKNRPPVMKIITPDPMISRRVPKSINRDPNIKFLMMRRTRCVFRWLLRVIRARECVIRGSLGLFEARRADRAGFMGRTVRFSKTRNKLSTYHL
jgi:hypothetical protein